MPNKLFVKVWAFASPIGLLFKFVTVSVSSPVPVGLIPNTLATFLIAVGAVVVPSGFTADNTTLDGSTLWLVVAASLSCAKV